MVRYELRARISEMLGQHAAEATERPAAESVPS